MLPWVGLAVAFPTDPRQWWTWMFPRAVGPLPETDPATVTREVVRRVGPDGILVLDDLHWVDEATLGIISRLVGTITLASAVRSTDPAAAKVIRHLASLGVASIDVPHLPEDVATALTRQRAPRLDPEAVRRIVDRAGGNPLLIEELARSGVSTSLQLALQHRLRALDRPSRWLLELLAIAGQPVPVPETRSLRRLQSLGLLETSEGRTEVRHALIAEVVIEALPAARLGELHRAAASLVGDPVAAARHLLAAGDRRAARDFASAAIQAAPPGQRAALASVVAECSEGPAAALARIDGAAQLVHAGWFREAERILDLANPVTPIGRARQLAVRAHTRWGLGDADGALAAVEDGLRWLAELSVDDSGDRELRELRASLLVDQAWSATMRRDGRQAVPLARQALEAVSVAGLPTGPAKRGLALALAIVGAPFQEAMPHLEAALAEARAAGDVGEELLCAKLVVALHESSGDAVEGRRLGEAFVARAREAGMLAWEQSIRATLVSYTNNQGDYKRALSEGVDLLAEPLERRTRSQAAGYLALALVDLGRLEEAAALIDTGLAVAPDDVDGRLDLASGEPGRADTLAAAVLDQFETADYCDLRHVRVTQAWARFATGADLGPPIPAVEMHAHVRGTVPESGAWRCWRRP
jgi:tetratricopeptide (TPR) repeat protein